MLLGAIDRSLRVDEGERPQSIAAWRQALAGEGKSSERATGSAHGPVTQSAEGAAISRAGKSWFRWTPLGMCVGVIVALLGASNQNAILFIAGALLGASAWCLYRAVSKDFKKGKNAYSIEEYREAIRWYSKAAEQDHAKAQHELGLMYARGEGVTKDYTEAARWCRKSAERGNAEAQYRVGLAYASGLGVAKDVAEAATWYQQAAERGHGEAQLALGKNYHFGTGVAQDQVAAYMWLDIATSTAAPNDHWRVEAREMRDEVEMEMTDIDISEAQRRARLCLESNADIWEAQRIERVPLKNYQQSD